MVSFSCAANRNICKMFFEGINAKDIEPVPDSLHVLEAEVPTACAIGFTESSSASKLIGHAGEFFDCADVAELGIRALAILIHKGIDCGPVVPGIHCHIVAAMACSGPAVLPVVTGEFEIVPVTIFVTRFCPAFDEEFEEELVEVVADFFVVTNRADEAGQVVYQVVSPAFFEVTGQTARPVDTSGGGQVRFVSEDAREAFAKMFSQLSAIRIQSYSYEFLCDSGSEKINVILSAIPTA